MSHKPVVTRDTLRVSPLEAPKFYARLPNDPNASSTTDPAMVWPGHLTIQPKPDPRLPTTALPGTAEKVWVLALRFALNLPLHVAGDHTGLSFDGGFLDDEFDCSLNTLIHYLSGRRRTGGARMIHTSNTRVGGSIRYDGHAVGGNEG